MFDPKCYELAEHFLNDDPLVIFTDKDRNALAQHIQNAIEGWIEDAREGKAEDA